MKVKLNNKVRAILILLVLLWSASQAEAQVDEIMKLRRQSNDAMKAGNYGIILDLYTEDIIIIKGDGEALVGKDKVKALFQNDLSTAEDTYFVRTPEQIEIGDGAKMAWETGQWRGYENGVEMSQYGGRYSMVWIETESGWKMRAQQFVNLR